MIGLVCLMLEMKAPGISVPGLIAAVCFLLFFWSHWQEAGVDLLALLLFLLGLILILLEVFVFPGLTIAGLGGVLLVVLSLALVALQKRPQTSEEWGVLLKLMLQFGLGLVGAVLLAVLVASYLPNIPLLNRLVLRPEGEAAGDGDGDGSPDGGRTEPVRPEVAALLGAIGVAVTPLRPAGKAKIGDEFLDVVSEGSFVNDGSRVQVVEIEGPRIVVKEVL
jgi:membrane-bound ClpP family serine protease